MTHIGYSLRGTALYLKSSMTRNSAEATPLFRKAFKVTMSLSCMSTAPSVLYVDEVVASEKTEFGERTSS